MLPHSPTSGHHTKDAGAIYQRTDLQGSRGIDPRGDHYLQDYRGWTSLATGLTFAIMGTDMVLVPVLTYRLVERFGDVPVMTAGLMAGVVAFALVLRLDVPWGCWDRFPSLLLVAGHVRPAVRATRHGRDGIDEAEHGVAGAVVYTASQFGSALGVSVATIALSTGTHPAAGLDDYPRTARPGSCHRPRRVVRHHRRDTPHAGHTKAVLSWRAG